MSAHFLVWSFMKPSDVLAEMAAFEAAMQGHFGDRPTRLTCELSILTQDNSLYASPHDCQLFLGWMMRATSTDTGARAPQNGEDLLAHCRSYEKVLLELLAQHNLRQSLIGAPTLPSTLKTVMLRDSIETAERGMQGSAEDAGTAQTGK